MRQQTAMLTFPELFQLPVSVSLATAARAFGFSTNTAYKLVRREAFPCRVIRPSWCYRVPTMSLMAALGVESLPVHFEDVESGMDFAARFDDEDSTGGRG
ncbi:DNA-binding protein [Catenulispora sp. GP43]|uniref:DNA-binding protein n=1 Tax=Catenulispora sp. GP43 TaxID=3156263 RepID=UPI003516B2EF